MFSEVFAVVKHPAEAERALTHPRVMIVQNQPERNGPYVGTNVTNISPNGANVGRGPPRPPTSGGPLFGPRCDQVMSIFGVKRWKEVRVDSSTGTGKGPD